MENSIFERLGSMLSDEEMAELQSSIRDLFMARMQQEKQEKVERYRRLNTMVRPGQILFVGSSLMEQFPIYELLLDRQLPCTIYNRGIGGYTTAELMNSMDVCIYDLKPSQIFINIGTNDLNGPDYREETLIANYRRILHGIKEHLPEAAVTLLAYYPINPEVGGQIPFMQELLKHRTNERIAAANAAVQQLAQEEGLAFLNVNAGITDEKGFLKAEYTIEGMHMYGNGYVPVLEALLPYLTRDGC